MFTRRDENIQKKWDNKSNIQINNTQYGFGKLEDQENFIKSQFDKEELQRYYEYRNEWYRRANEFDYGDKPLAVIIELVSTCNLACSMCYTITEEFQSSTVGSQRIMPWNLVRKIIDECAELNVPSILFSWRGESTMYKSIDEKGQKIDFADVLKYAREKGILEITSLTNGQKIDIKLAKKIVDAEPNWISFSIDGLSNAYNKIRTQPTKDNKIDSFNLVIENIKNLINLRNQKKSNRPQIRTNTIYPPIENREEEYYDFMKNIGVDWLTVNELLDFRGKEIPEEDILKNWKCQYPWQRLTISSNGIILPCPGSHNEEEDLVLGRYRGSSPKEIKINGTTITKNYPETTSYCGFCLKY